MQYFLLIGLKLISISHLLKELHFFYKNIFVYHACCIVYYLNNSIINVFRIYNHICMGGTFDRIHVGRTIIKHCIVDLILNGPSFPIQ